MTLTRRLSVVRHSIRKKTMPCTIRIFVVAMIIKPSFAMIIFINTPYCVICFDNLRVQVINPSKSTVFLSAVEEIDSGYDESDPDSIQKGYIVAP